MIFFQLYKKINKQKMIHPRYRSLEKIQIPECTGFSRVSDAEHMTIFWPSFYFQGMSKYILFYQLFPPDQIRNCWSFQNNFSKKFSKKIA